MSSRVIFLSLSFESWRLRIFDWLQKRKSHSLPMIKVKLILSWYLTVCKQTLQSNPVWHYLSSRLNFHRIPSIQSMRLNVFENERSIGWTVRSMFRTLVAVKWDPYLGSRLTTCGARHQMYFLFFLFFVLLGLFSGKFLVDEFSDCLMIFKYQEITIVWITQR